MSPGAQERQSLGLVVEHVAQDLSHTTHTEVLRAYPARQPVQTVAEEQEEQPVGHTIGAPPTTAVAMLVVGLFTQALLESRENPTSQIVQTLEEAQVRQLVEQAAQVPLET